MPERGKTRNFKERERPRAISEGSKRREKTRKTPIGMKDREVLPFEQKKLRRQGSIPNRGRQEKKKVFEGLFSKAGHPKSAEDRVRNARGGSDNFKSWGASGGRSNWKGGRDLCERPPLKKFYNVGGKTTAKNGKKKTGRGDTKEATRNKKKRMIVG